jgi:hypothetical protein
LRQPLLDNVWDQENALRVFELPTSLIAERAASMISEHRRLIDAFASGDTQRLCTLRESSSKPPPTPSGTHSPFHRAIRRGGLMDVEDLAHLTFSSTAAVKRKGWLHSYLTLRTCLGSAI